MNTVTLTLPREQAQFLVDDLNKRASRLRSELEQIESSITSLSNQLGERSVTRNNSSESASSSSSSSEPGPKRPKGENNRVIQDYLKGQPKGTVAAQIVRATGIGSSSVHAVLKRNSDVFVKGNDGVWKLR